MTRRWGTGFAKPASKLRVRRALRNAPRSASLKRELDRVKRERDILAKAVAFFSASTRENG